MKKYTIELAGLGAECYVFPLNEEQLTTFKNGGVVDNKMDMGEVESVLGVDSFFDSKSIYLGPYDDSDLYHINILDENNELIMGLNGSRNFNVLNDDDYVYIHDEEKNLIIEDSCKGVFFKYALELEDDFDVLKLSPIITEIGECINIITGLRYDGEVLEITDYGDYWSKGIYYCLS